MVSAQNLHPLASASSRAQNPYSSENALSAILASAEFSHPCQLMLHQQRKKKGSCTPGIITTRNQRRSLRHDCEITAHGLTDIWKSHELVREEVYICLPFVHPFASPHGRPFVLLFNLDAPEAGSHGLLPHSHPGPRNPGPRGSLPFSQAGLE